MVTTFLACIIHPLITMLANMNRTAAFSEGNSEAQVHRPPRPWNLKSGALSCYMCWPTLTKWIRTWGKFSTNLFNTLSLFCIQPLVSLIGTGNFFVNSSIAQGILPCRNMIPFLSRVREMDCPISFLGSNRRYRPI
jgi:hypothetical protein